MKNSFVFCAGLAVVLAVLCVFVASCASSKAAEPVPTVDLTGDWILSSIKYDISLYDGYDGASDFVDGLKNSGKSAGISFSADADTTETGETAFAVYGFSGVNTYNGSVSFDGGSLLANPPAVTLMAGQPQAERFERVYLHMLAKMEGADVAVDDTTLTLRDASGENELVFTRFQLAGTSWALSAYNTGNAVVSLPTSVDIPTLVFGDAGALSGSTGVNRITGSFTSDSKTRALSFGNVGTTRMGAPNAQMAEVERIFLDLLEDTVSYRISGPSLTFCSADGTNLLMFYML